MRRDEMQLTDILLSVDSVGPEVNENVQKMALIGQDI